MRLCINLRVLLKDLALSFVGKCVIHPPAKPCEAALRYACSEWQGDTTDLGNRRFVAQATRLGGKLHTIRSHMRADVVPCFAIHDLVTLHTTIPAHESEVASAMGCIATTVKFVRFHIFV